MHHRAQRFRSAPELQPARITHPSPSPSKNTHTLTHTHSHTYDKYTRTESWRNIIDDVTLISCAQYIYTHTIQCVYDNILLTERRGVCANGANIYHLPGAKPWTYALHGIILYAYNTRPCGITRHRARDR